MTLWVIAPLAGVIVHHRVGAPHLLWAYDYTPALPYGTRVYTSCTYLGWDGRPTTVRPTDGTCPVVRLMPRPEHQRIEP